MKIRPLGAELFCVDRQTDRQTERQTDRQTDGRTDRQTERQTDMTRLIVAFRNFANAPPDRALPHSVPIFCTVRTVTTDFFPQLCVLRAGTECVVLCR